jgi:photosystem II stability/assembly factor-like uncharacterized protein
VKNSTQTALAFALLALSSGSCHRRSRATQREWRWENPRPTGVSLLSACTTIDGSLVAAGEVGTLLVRREGRWSRLATELRANLVSVACCPDGRIVAVSEEGHAVTFNRGARRIENLGATLRAVHCASDNTVVAASGEPRVHVQRPGAAFSTHETAERFVAVTRSSHQWIGSAFSGRIYKADDPSRAWTPIANAVRPALSFAHAGDVTLAVGSVGTALVSRDGGSHWSVVNLGSNDDWITAHHDGVFFRVAGTANVVMRSRDGVSWEREAGSTPPRAFGFARDGAHLLLVGDDGFVSERNDREWTRRDAPRGSIFALAATDSERWAIGREGTLLRQRVVGGPWAVERIDVPQDLRSIALSAQQAIVVGDGGVIARSTDRGRSWVRRESRTDKPLYAAWADDHYRAIVVGEGVVLRSTDGGDTWALTPLPDRWVLRSIAFDGEWLWAGGDGERVMRTRDFGRNWEYVALPRMLRIQQMLARPRRTMLVFTKDNVVLERVGDRWVEHPAPAEILWDAAVSGESVFAIGPSGAMFRATHALEWTAIAPLTNEGLFAIAVTASGAVYAAGEFGAILSYR